MICPVGIWEKFLEENAKPEEPTDFIFDAGMMNRIRATTKWIASSLGMRPKFFAAHSLRAGGASTLFANGIALGEIKRFGRWIGDTFHIYLYGDTLNLRVLSSALCTDNQLLDQIRTASDQKINLMPERRGCRKSKRGGEEFESRVGGAQSDYVVRTRQDRSECRKAESRSRETFGEELLHGLVDPKFEDVKEEEECMETSTRCHRMKEEKCPESPRYYEDACPADTDSPSDPCPSAEARCDSVKGENIDDVQTE